MPIESSPDSQAAFANSLASPAYASNIFAAVAASPIVPTREQVAWLAPAADTYVAEDDPNSSFGGSAPFLYVSGLPGAQRRAYLRFDLSALGGRTIDSAAVQVTTTGDSWAGSSGPALLQLDTNNALQESGATWNNQGGPGDVSPTPLATLTATTLLSASYTFSVPASLVRRHAGGLLSFEITTPSRDNLVLYSREASRPSLRPQLIVSSH
jgi:hypothetical protein